MTTGSPPPRGEPLCVGWKSIPQEPAGRPEVVRDEDLAVIADDHLRDDHRLGRGVLRSFVDGQQAAVRQHRAVHLQRVDPARPHQFRRDSASQQHAGVDRLRRGPEYRRCQRPGRDVDHSGQFDLADDSVVDADHDIQRSGVDLHELARSRHRQLSEQGGGPVGCRPAGDRRPGRVRARRQPVQQTVERSPRRQFGQVPAVLPDDLPRPPDQVGPIACRGLDAFLDRLPHRRDEGVRCVTELLALADRTVVHEPGQSDQAVLHVTASPQPHRAGLDLVAEGREFGSLGLLA